MSELAGRIAWITGAGTGIGEAAALALARAGATTILSGRRRKPLEQVAAQITAAGGIAHVQPGDMTQSAAVQAIAAFIHTTFGKLDILVANAGLNIADRRWSQLTPQGADEVITGNLSSVFYGITSVLPMMRAQQDGVIIITASVAGRFISALGGPAYTAAKHGVVALSHSVNMEECVNGIRCTAVLPGEVATPILDKRPTPVSAEDRARMLQSNDVGDLIRYVACLPRHVVINEVMISPTWNRGYIRALGA